MPRMGQNTWTQRIAEVRRGQQQILREPRWRRPALCRLLKCERQLDELWLTACRPGEAHAVRSWPGRESGGECVGSSPRRNRNQRVRHSNRRITRARADVGAAHAREEERIEAMCRDCLIDPACRREEDVLPAVRLVLRAIRLEVHLVG